MMRIGAVALTLVGCASLTTKSVTAPQRHRRSAVAMSAVPPGGKVLCVGNGPMFLLAAKTAAAAGYDTTIVSARQELYATLLWGEGEEPLPNLSMLGVTSDGDVEAFNAAVANSDAVVIAFDAEQCLTDALFDVVLPPSGSKCRRVALLSRNLSGKGMGPFAIASKAAANKEVWAATKASLEMYKTFEAKIAARIAERTDTDSVTVRVGTLKGGGPGDIRSDPDITALSFAYYSQINRDLVNWQLLFDCDTRGVKLMPGDTAPGPSWRAVFTSTSPDAEDGDTGRIAAAQALIRSLSLEGAGGKDFGVCTAQGRTSPTDSEWSDMLTTVLA